MDALSDILRVARLSGGVFFNAEFSAPWCIAARMAPELCAPFLGATHHLIPYHYVVDGEMQVALADQPRPDDSAAAKSCCFRAMIFT